MINIKYDQKKKNLNGFARLSWMLRFDSDLKSDLNIDRWKWLALIIIKLDVVTCNKLIKYVTHDKVYKRKNIPLECVCGACFLYLGGDQMSL